MRTSPSLLIATLAVTLLSSACQGPTAMLDSLTGPTILVVAMPVDEMSRSSTPEFEFKALLSHRGECVPLDPAAHGTIDGERAPQWFAGRERTDFRVLAGWQTWCDVPSFHIPVASADKDEVTLAFEDGTTRIATTILGLGRAQSLTVTPPADGHIRPGSTIRLDYAPATDDLSTTSWTLQGPDHLPGTAIDISQRQGSSVFYTIPASHPAGPVSVLIYGGRTPAVAACEGAVECDAILAVYPFPDQPVFRQVSASFTIE